MSKIYLKSAFQSMQNFLIMAKFAFYWFFTQPSHDMYSILRLEFYSNVPKLIQNIIEEEKLDP